MEVRFHAEALAEFKAATAYYEQSRAGLGQDYADEVLRMVALVRLFPSRGSPVEDGVRSWIWAVMHASREPGYWKVRVRTGS